ncbi:DNA-binding transcriptional regulator [Chroococcidiopsis sp. TS-821]|uniref:helix-turn-helix domain-containing protein n=1 Tax=Chroococcidiopsis sp. TS-821 TaxID=1378066 RepID=UPI000CEF360D|nr:helix-turn-helix transcriptional regulator [Chroococcidiopsis sp. TS-821]PPS43918.1 transcriptional regulator [Chroococcidiopsis sp. TS-821]
MIKKRLVIDQPFIGKFIREVRQEIGLTQEQFAAEVGVTCSSVNRWENGRGKPLPLAMEKILTMLEQMGERGQELLAKYSNH